MARVRAKARIGERTISVGPVFTLLGAFDASHNPFASIMAVGDTTTASVVEPGVAFWTGVITYSATNQITLTSDVEETKGAFGSGTKEVLAGPLASTSMFQEDISGAIVTGGSLTAYTISSFRKYDTLARLHGNMIAFTPHVTNGQTVTLNVDALGAKPLRLAPGVDLQSNTLSPGTPYTATYSNVDGAWYLHALGGNPYGIPLGAGLDYWGATTPSSAFIFPAGQLLSRAAYPALFTLFGTRYGAGDGSTTFGVPDKTERVSEMKAASAARLTTAGSGVDGGTLGAVGGAQNATQTLAQLPTGITSSGNNTINVDSATTQGGPARNSCRTPPVRSHRTRPAVPRGRCHPTRLHRTYFLPASTQSASRRTTPARGS
jgi:microcystin-dependent protein